MPLDLHQFQQETNAWARRNFGDSPGHQPLLLLAEEVGELAHHYLKREQGIHTEQDHDVGIEDAVGDVFIGLLDFCNVEGLGLEACVRGAWERVRERDWRAHPGNGTAPTTTTGDGQRP